MGSGWGSGATSATGSSGVEEDSSGVDVGSSGVEEGSSGVEGSSGCCVGSFVVSFCVGVSGGVCSWVAASGVFVSALGCSLVDSLRKNSLEIPPGQPGINSKQNSAINEAGRRSRVMDTILCVGVDFLLSL